ncbi:MAG: hypothetical protein ABL920_07180 [Methylotenera sp.]
MTKHLTLVILFSAQLVGCASYVAVTPTEVMYIKASALTKLSASVESTVRYENPPENISDEDLLILATAHDPSLLVPFADYTLKVLKADQHSAVLVCTKDSAQGLLEDAGCTAAMDAHHWKNEGILCDFTLNLSTLCAAP